MLDSAVIVFGQNYIKNSIWAQAISEKLLRKLNSPQLVLRDVCIVFTGNMSYNLIITLFCCYNSAAVNSKMSGHDLN